MKRVVHLANSSKSLFAVSRSAATSIKLLQRRKEGAPVTGLRRVRISKGNIHNALAWMGIGCVLIAALWIGVRFKLESEKAYIIKDALKDTAHLSQSYADQLARSIEQIDQITLHLGYEWKKSAGSIELEVQPEQGFFPLISGLHAWIVDRQGYIRTSSFKGDVGRNIANEDYFRKQQSGEAKGLLIGNPTGSYLSDHTVIHFSRKVKGADGSFDGVVVVASEPSYLESFINQQSIGRNDSVTLKKNDGTLLASKRGANIRSIPTIYRSPSLFSTDKGAARIDAAHFVDNEPRIVAWSKLKDYPLMSIVNQSEKDTLQAYRELARDYQLFAVGGSILLFLFSIIGINFSTRLANKRRQAEETKNTYRLATEAAREGFFTIKTIYGENRTIEDFVIEDCNDRGANFIGFTKSSVIGQKFSSIYTSPRAQQVFSVFRIAMENGYYEDELKLSTRDRAQPVWLSRKLVRSGEGLAVNLRDISEAKAHELELTKLANTDVLTSFPNRHWMSGYLPTALDQAKKNHACLALLMIDLDDFKNINDTSGHATGDELLKLVAARLQSLLRPSDHIVRLGGDEFTIISEGYEISASVSPLAERICQALGQPFLLKDGSPHHVKASIGISIYPQDGFEPETLLKHADIAMYAAKNDGKGRYQFYQAHFSEKLRARISNEHSIRKAIEKDEFVLFFQPRTDAVSGELKSLEALIRWLHPTRGMVSPISFIPFAESNDLIVDLGSLVIGKVCRQIAEWKGCGYPVVPVSVNISAKQFNQGNLISVLEAALRQYEIDVALLEVEITESSMIEDNHLVLEEMSAIKKMGIKLLIDDFGTGYSSMSQLHRLDLDVLKIDQAFTRSLKKGHKGEAFFKAMISMAHALDMDVVAEGVESMEQLEILRSLECDEVQGFYISEPLPAEEIPGLMQKRFLFPDDRMLN